MISENLKQESWAQESKLPLVLLEISHPDLADPIRIVNDKANITSNGDEYIGYPFQIYLPDSNEDSPPRAKIRVDNVSREIGQSIRQISTPPSVSLKVIRPDTPDIIEFQYSGMKLRHVPYDALTIEGDLEFEDLTKEPFPGYTFSPANYHGILQ